MTAAPPLYELVAGIRDVRAERVVLAGAMRAAELVLPRLSEMGFTDDAFAVWAHRLVWRACVGLYNAGRDVDGHAVYRRLAMGGELNELGRNAAVWVAEVWDADPTGAWAWGAAKDVLALAEARAEAHRACETIRDSLTMRRAI